VSTLQHLEEETFIIDVKTLGSIPSLAPMASAYDTPTIEIAKAMLLQILAISPAPGF
jgi:hypothetical protein